MSGFDKRKNDNTQPTLRKSSSNDELRRRALRNRSRGNSMSSSDNPIAASSDSQIAEGSIPREQQAIFPSGERRFAVSPEPINPQKLPQEQSSRETLQTLRNEIGSSVQPEPSLQNTTDISDTTALAEATFSRLDRLTKHDETQLNKIPHARSNHLGILSSNYRSSAEIYATTGVDTLRSRAAVSMKRTLADINKHLDTIERDLGISLNEQNP